MRIMKKGIVFTLLTFAALCLLFTANASAATFYVDDDGDPASTFVNLDTAFATAATFGPGPHTIVIEAGTYSDVNQAVPANVGFITGAGADVVTFTDPDFQTNIFLDVNGTTDLTISGIKVVDYKWGIVTDSNGYGPSYVGLGADGLTVTDCEFYGCVVTSYDGTDFSTHSAAIAGTFSNSTFENLVITNGEIGIGVWDFGDLGVINGNQFLNVYADTLEGFGIGVFGSAEDYLVDGCTVMNADDRAIQFWNTGTGTSGNIDILNSTVVKALWEGILLHGVNGATSLIDGNDVSDCAYGTTNTFSTTTPYGGIYVLASDDVKVFNNTCVGNGDGAGLGDYGIYVGGGTSNVRVKFNCLYGHAGVQGYDAGDGTNFWTQNYYGLPYVTPYPLDGAVETDNNPNTFDQSAHADPTTYEVYDYVDVTFDWTVPGCDPADTVTLAAYEFTVNWDPTYLEYTEDNYAAAYDYGFLGDPNPATYAPILIDEVAGTMTFAAANFVEPAYGDAVLSLAQFKGIALGTTNITINSVYINGDGDTLNVSTTPLALTIEDTGAPTITVVPNDPIGTDTYSDYVDLEVTGDVTDNFDLYRVWYRFDDAGGWSFVANVDGEVDTYGPTTIDFSALAEGSHTLNMRVGDGAGNYGYVDYDFDIDRTAPVVTSVTLSDADGCAFDGEYTNDPTVTVDIVDDGTGVEMEFALPGNPEGFIPYANPTTYTLPTADGTYQVYVRLKDVYGNEGSWTAFDNITLDQVAPMPTDMWLVSDPTPAKTNLTTIDLDANWGAVDGTVQINYSEDIGALICGDAGWQALAGATRPFSFDLSAGDGMKTVYYGSADAAGNIGIDSAMIELDQTAPEFLTFDVPDCSPIRNVQDIAFTWDSSLYPDAFSIKMGIASGTYDDNNGLAGQDPDDGLTDYYRLPNADGDYTIYAVLVDDIGNVSAEVSDNVTLDRVAPTAGTMALNGGLSWSNSATVDVELTGLDMDIVEVAVTETAGDYTGATWMAFDPNTPVFQYTFASITDGQWRTLYLKARDCAGNESAEVSDNVRIDLTAPTLSDVLINGGATVTNDPLVDIDFTYTESYPLNVYISEDAGMAGAVTVAWGAGPAYPDAFTLTTGDGDKPVYVQIEDRAGNMSTIETSSILLDETAPTGTMELVQDPAYNPYAAPGYTNTKNNILIENITYPADAVDMRFRNSDGTNLTGWLPVAASYSPWTLSGTMGTLTAEVKFRDAAGNVGGWNAASIEFDFVAPGTVQNLTGTPTASTHLDWDAAGADDQYYVIRYNFSGEYPTYVNLPPAPAISEGFAAGMPTDTEFDFVGPFQDIYAFSVWVVDMAGNWGPVDSSVKATNYLLGDFDGDGVLKFVEEFGDLASTYGLSTGDAGFKDYSDIGPTDDGTSLGLPEPDGYIGFDDLLVFAANYATNGDYTGGPNALKVFASDQIKVHADVPQAVSKGAEFTFAVELSQMRGVMGYQIALGSDNLEIISVEAGAAHENVTRSFFDDKIEEGKLTLTGVVLGEQFGDNELARVTVRALDDGQVSLEGVSIDIRDFSNQRAESSFELAASGEPLVIPNEFTLAQNYPNPFNPTTTIDLYMAEAGNYRIEIFNVAGQMVKVFSGYSQPGKVSVQWDASNVGSGVYLYRAVSGTNSQTKKMILLK
jgi:hypothetical protein